MSDAAHADPHAADHGDHHDPNLAHHFDSMEQQFESGKLGMWVFLATEILMFGGLFCAYAIYRGNNPDIFLFAHQALDTQMGAINTVVLLASSFTMAVGVKAASQGRQALLMWMLVITFLGGVGFMTIKTMEYTAKWDKGLWFGTQNAFYTNADGFTDEEGNADPKKKEYVQNKAIDYIEHHGHGDDAGHAGDEKHGGEAKHGDKHGEDDHTDVSPGNTTGVELEDDHDLATAAAPGDGEAEVLAAPPGTAGSAAWPPVPADRMTLAAPVNLAAATNEPFLNAPPEIGPVAGMLSGVAEAQAAALAGPAYPGFAVLSPLDQERTHIFFQIYFVMTGLHGLHVLIGMGLIFWVGVAALKTPFGPSYYAPVDIVGLYWHLVDLIWIFLFPLLYLIH